MYIEYFTLRVFGKAGPRKTHHANRFNRYNFGQLMLASVTNFFYIISGIAHFCMGSMNSDL
jgi:hypothetical protein